jgi:hypothetical protein
MVGSCGKCLYFRYPRKEEPYYKTGVGVCVAFAEDKGVNDGPCFYYWSTPYKILYFYWWRLKRYFSEKCKWEFIPYFIPPRGGGQFVRA